jgi:hypothetical protein
VNLRPSSTQDLTGAFGYYAFGVRTFHVVGADTDFWALAREVRDGVARKVQEGAPLRALRLLERRAPRDAGAGRRLVTLLDKYPYHPVAVSNLGRLEAPERLGDVAWEGFGCGATMATGAANLGWATATFRGRLQAVFVHPEPLVSRARGRRVAGAFLGHLHRAAEG